MRDLNTLVDRARQGELDAYEEIVQRFQNMAVGYAYALLGDFHLAEDAAQEAFLGAYHNLPRLQAAEAFTNWFRQIVFRQCQQHRRRYPSTTVSMDAIGEPVSTAPGPAEEMESALTRQQILAALTDLPEAERQVVTLFYISEYNQSEIAGFLGVSVDTVKNRLRSGRNLLTERLLTMAKKTLRQQAPSQDESFVTVVGLCNAVQAGDVGRVRQLLETDPALAWRPISQNDQLAIQFAAREGHIEIVALLLEAGADPLKGAYPNRKATSALAYARDRGHDAVVRLIQDYLERHPRQAPEPDQAARLLAAVAANKLDEARALLAANPALAGEKIPVPSVDRTVLPLREAARRGLLEMSTLLLDAGADPDAPCDLDLGDEGTYRNAGEPLWYAAAAGSYEMCRLLLERGADPNAVVFASGPAAERALEKGRQDIVDLLYSHGGRGYAVAAALCGQMAVPAEVMALRPEIAHNILWAAAYAGNIDLTKLCLRYDLKEEEPAAQRVPAAVGLAPRVDWFQILYQPLRGRVGQAALRYADGARDELQDKLEILRLLLEHGADVKVRDGSNQTLLHRLAGEASSWADAEKVGFAGVLLDFGAEIDARDDDLKSTPLGLAARYGHLALVECLLERGASLRLPDDEAWNTPLAWAEKQGHEEIAARLRARGERVERSSGQS